MNTIVTAYEVLRVINSKPLFAKDHFLRLEYSIKSIDNEIQISELDFLTQISDLIQTNKIVNGNIKIEAQINLIKKCLSIKSLQLAHHYPSENDYQFGVNAVTYRFVRENPNSKIWNQTLREITDEIIASQKVFEVIYVNDKDCLTEGSRSNLFFIKDNQLISAPESDILLGITRKYIIETACVAGMKLIEKDVNLSEISEYSCAFISGTSPKILPLKLLNQTEFDVNNHKLRNLMTDFNKVIEANINNFTF
jgi:branched-chain amino acid aminotransferase